MEYQNKKPNLELVISAGAGYGGYQPLIFGVEQLERTSIGETVEEWKNDEITNCFASLQ
ncbi:hypothetical protein Glove_57g114 [Diversispora epigaea]|uniref:Uncharacterized protein n=1 Tax=Diversispora epigaea TaxID=1348612 RepID=A0A397JM36_9GLOM|nr:hypothetical protein Glove_57g114 [Diversispora epigaea]